MNIFYEASATVIGFDRKKAVYSFGSCPAEIREPVFAIERLRFVSSSPWAVYQGYIAG